jgi:glycosyltransferase involved in cell wall biosynthesis
MPASEMKSAARPVIAVVLATYNRARPLEHLLQALERQTIARDAWEVVVVVDGSKDDSEGVLARWVARGTLPLQFLVQNNAGQSVARHNGILHSSAEHVIVIDDDMEVCREFVEEHLAASRKAPGKVVVIGKVVPEKTFMKKPLFTAVGEHHLLLLHARLEQGEQPPTATAFVTQNVSFPRRLYLDRGGFDASLRLDEDRELGIRLERAGAMFVFAPKAWAIHHSDVGSYEKWSRRHYEYGKYALQVWEKHGQSPLLHPLRNYVDGSRLNRLLVTIVCAGDVRSKVAESALRWMGNTLQRLEIFEPAIYTHKAIQAVRYHQGLRDALGSWGSLRRMEGEYVASPDRPRKPTGAGATYEGSTPST